MNPINNELCGVISVIKPPGFTSHDIVAIMRRVLKFKKIGHTGTLDPNATGVLPICVGRATKISEHLMNDTKEYICGVTFGIKTDTMDNSGSILEINDFNIDILKDDSIIESILKDFRGEIVQIPPAFSALKINGKKMYELAREGKSVDMSKKARKITIESIEVVKNHEISTIEGEWLESSRESLSNNLETHLLLRIRCSKGTYIRSICNDIGEKLGVGGSMSSLVRNRTGQYTIEESISIEELRNMEYEYAVKKLMPIESAFQFDKIIIPDIIRPKILNGVRIDLSVYRDKDKIKKDNIRLNYMVYDENNIFIGLASTKINEDEKSKITIDKLFL